ncbi:MAG: MerR family transcriptional regulator [Anaerolineales bacterium]
MVDIKEAATFNVKAVAQETGLKADTLRAWERRYGLPQPDRSDGGHRLYSEHDIEILKWLVGRQDEGLSISNAVDLWNRLIENGENPLQMPEYRPAPAVRGQPVLAAGESVDELRRGWIEACLAFDDRRAEQILDQALGMLSVETVVLQVIRAGIVEIGKGWYQGDIAVQQEHFSSELAVRRLETLLSSTPPPSRSDVLLLTCPPHEDHTFGLLTAALLLRRRGWPVVYLGGDVPLDQMRSAVDGTGPKLVVAAALQIHSAASLRQLGDHLQELDVPLAYGGEIFDRMPAMREHIRGHFLGNDLAAIAEKVESLVENPSSLPPARPTPEPYKAALVRYRADRPLIERRVTTAMVGEGQVPPWLPPVNEYMGRGLEAGLILGNLSFLDDEIGWVEELIVHHLPTENSLPDYLDAYYLAVQEIMAEAGQPILEWFGKRGSRI